MAKKAATSSSALQLNGGLATTNWNSVRIPTASSFVVQPAATLPATPATSSATKNKTSAAHCLVQSRATAQHTFAQITAVSSAGSEASADGALNFEQPATVIIIPPETLGNSNATNELRAVLEEEAVLIDRQRKTVWRLPLDATLVLDTLSQLGFATSHCCVDHDGVFTWTMVCSNNNNVDNKSHQPQQNSATIKAAEAATTAMPVRSVASAVGARSLSNIASQGRYVEQQQQQLGRKKFASYLSHDFSDDNDDDDDEGLQNALDEGDDRRRSSRTHLVSMTAGNRGQSLAVFNVKDGGIKRPTESIAAAAARAIAAGGSSSSMLARIRLAGSKAFPQHQSNSNMQLPQAQSVQSLSAASSSSGIKRNAAEHEEGVSGADTDAVGIDSSLQQTAGGGETTATTATGDAIKYEQDDEAEGGDGDEVSGSTFDDLVDPAHQQHRTILEMRTPIPTSTLQQTSTTPMQERVRSELAEAERQMEACMDAMKQMKHPALDARYEELTIVIKQLRHRLERLMANYISVKKHRAQMNGGIPPPRGRRPKHRSGAMMYSAGGGVGGTQQQLQLVGNELIQSQLGQQQHDQQEQEDDELSEDFQHQQQQLQLQQSAHQQQQKQQQLQSAQQPQQQPVTIVTHGTSGAVLATNAPS